jgi:hypothetical protein
MILINTNTTHKEASDSNIFGIFLEGATPDEQLLAKLR